ncbi:hypothetical protein TSUD_284480 [Trifolium subterraneum]|uniref:RRM domain-containing protein n=1 Tax=Trifolium subterraneum TaxID=3900 RepID=A0A2Z6NJ57_TRISU|nr:hypothetical protein TSUD_284480 [Trifolium subterraneum]
MRGRESERGGGSRVYLGQPRRYSVSPAERLSWREGIHAGGHIWGGGDMGEWQEVRRRRRKAPREVEHGHYRQQEFPRHCVIRSRSPWHWKYSFRGRSCRGYLHRFQARTDDDQPRCGFGSCFDNAGTNRVMQKTANQTDIGPYQQLVWTSSGKLQLPRREHGLFRQQQDWSEHSKKHGYAAKHQDCSDGFHDSGRSRNMIDEQYGLGTVFKRYVSYYITNFPPLISLFHLRKGFEVCGILEDVYVARKRNVHGEVYGFVKFSNVKNAYKLEKALNVVSFGNFRVFARVARFDKHDVVDGRIPGMNKCETKAAEIVGVISGPAAKGEANVEGVQVGDVFVRLWGEKEKEVVIGVSEKGVSKIIGHSEQPKETESAREVSIFVCKYTPSMEDVLWAQSGVVATIINGEAVTVVQHRIEDAGFTGLVIIPLGANKVLIRSVSVSDAATVIDGAREFFNLVFSNLVRWNKEVVSSQRGAWVRLYGIPLHAWNDNFFKLWVLDYRRYLRADSSTIDKERLDFARILLATTSLEVVKRVEKVLVDGELIEVKVVEECGLDLGEDACLIDDELEVEAYHSYNEVAHYNPEASNNVDMFVDKITDELGVGKEKGDCEALRDKTSSQIDLRQAEFLSRAEGQVSVANQVVTQCEESTGERVNQASERGEQPYPLGNLNIVNPEKTSNPRSLDGGGRSGNGTKEQPKERTKSCPPGVNRSATSGPWNLDWLQDHNHGE